MQFNSIEFVFYFLPVFLLAYYKLPKSWRSSILLLGSVVFYLLNCGEKYWMAALLAGLTVLTYGVGRWMAKHNRGWLLPMSLIILGGILVFFKAYDHGKHLPLGISFYLFQMTAYLADVYQNKIQPEKNILTYSGKILMFPKLLSGPLTDPAELSRQDAAWEHPAENFHRGLQELILGMAMKVLLADRIAGLWSQTSVIGYESISPAFAWLALVTFCLRLYLDFWGYSLMAIGLGRIIGFELPRNFDDPYTARSVSEFYRRWHVSLGAWFRNYIYIPLGGNRKGNLRTILNLAVVWLFTGLWHGVGPGYLLWAGILLFFIVNERLWLGKLLKRAGFLAHLYTIFAILFSWIPFAIGDTMQMVTFTGRLFGQLGSTLNAMDFWVWGKEYMPMLAAGLLLATGLPGKLWNKIREKRLADVFIFVLFWVVVYGIATMEQSSFFYFQY